MLTIISNILEIKKDLSLSLIMKTDDKIICINNFKSILRSIEYLKKYRINYNSLNKIYELILLLKIIDKYVKLFRSELDMIYEVDINKVYDLKELCYLHTKIANDYKFYKLHV